MVLRFKGARGESMMRENLKMPLGRPLREFLGENCRLKYAILRMGTGSGSRREGWKNTRASGCSCDEA